MAARSLPRAQEFAKKFNIDKAYGSYQELAKDPQVEIVYVGVIAPNHFQVVTLMLQAGKHVLCEKPLAVSLKQVEEMLSLARSKGLFLMEAIWSRTFPVYHKMKDLLENGTIGTPKHTFVTFGKGGNDAPNARLSKKANGGGSLLDLGVYCIQMCLLAYGSQRPTKVTATAININEDGVDTGLSVTLHFPNGGFATFDTDLRVTLHNRAIIAGTKGFIRLASPFWCPTTIYASSEEGGDVYHDIPIPPGAKYSFNFENSAGLVYEADHVRQCLKDKLIQSPLVTHQDSLLIAEIQDEIMRQIGVSYVDDE